MSNGVLLAHITFSLLLFLLLPTKRLSQHQRLALLIVISTASFLTIGGLSLGDYLRSYTDDLAITTLLWFAWCVLSRLRGVATLSAVHAIHIALCFAILALVLYPATLGLSNVDPYRMGFSPAPLLAAMGATCLWFWWQGNHVAVGLIAVATAAYLLDVKDSDNYWDYLIDPLLGLYCMVFLLLRLLRTAAVKIGLIGTAK